MVVILWRAKFDKTCTTTDYDVWRDKTSATTRTGEKFHVWCEHTVGALKVKKIELRALVRWARYCVYVRNYVQLPRLKADLRPIYAQLRKRKRKRKRPLRALAHPLRDFSRLACVGRSF